MDSCVRCKECSEKAEHICYEHEAEKQNELKTKIIILAVGTTLFAVSFLFSSESKIKLILSISAIFILGTEILIKAVKNIFEKNFLDENFLMTSAVIGAVLLGEYTEGAAVMALTRIGELFEIKALNKSKNAIKALMNIKADYANLKTGNTIEKVSPEQIKEGDLIVIKSGEKIPLDGIIIEGSSILDTSALTGESTPKKVNPKDEVLAGCINISGALIVKVTAEYKDSTAAKIIELTKESFIQKTKTVSFISEFAKYYTPSILFIAVIIAFIPQFFTKAADFHEWIYSSLIFLMISCPCALVISVPLAFFSGIGKAAKKGIHIKESRCFENLAKAEIAVFDKTGTLTKGKFEVTAVNPVEMTEEELLEIAACAESFSNHPVAYAIMKKYGKAVSKKISNCSEIPGQGIKANIEGNPILAGNIKLMNENKIKNICQPSEFDGTAVYIAKNGKYSGHILLDDPLKSDAEKTIKKLKAEGINKIVMLSGDTHKACLKTASALGIKDFYSELLPIDKLEKIKTLISEKTKKGKLIFIGDGINDAPVLAGADIGIAMGTLGSHAAAEAADILIMTDEPSKTYKAVKYSKQTLNIVKQNIVLALSIKFTVMILGAVGIAGMWEAVFADVGVSIIAVLNAMRNYK